MGPSSPTGGLLILAQPSGTPRTGLGMADERQGILPGAQQPYPQMWRFGCVGDPRSHQAGRQLLQLPNPK